MRRAVITGLGIVSSIGVNKEDVLASLKAGKSGITFSEQFAEMGLRSQVWGNLDIDLKEHIDRKAMRFMGDAAAYAYVASRLLQILALKKVIFQMIAQVLLPAPAVRLLKTKCYLPIFFAKKGLSE